MILQAGKFNPADVAKPAALCATNLGGPTLGTFYPGPFALQLASTLPAQPFVNHAFSLCMYLIDGHGQIVRGQKVPLILQLAFAGADSSATSGGSNYFTCSPSNIFVDADGVAEFSITFLPTALQASTRVFVLRAYLPQSAADSLGGSSAFPPQSIATNAGNGGVEAAAAAPALSNGKGQSADATENMVLVFASKPMYIVTQRLVVTANLQSATGGAEKGGHVWYKDEGGRDHGIDLTIKLVDENDSIVRGQEIPLLVQLLYQNNDPVHKPNMLTLIDGSSTTSPLSSLSGNVFVNLHIDASSGIARTRLRINDISKNHQRQLFKVRVSADISKSALFGNVGSGETVGIEVKSKRTKRLREGAPMTGLGHHTGSANTFHGLGQKHSSQGKESMGLYNDGLMYEFDEPDYGLAALPSAKKTKPQAAADPVIPLKEDQLDRMDVPPYMIREASASVNLAAAPSSSGIIAPSSSHSMDHLRSVIKWTELVLDQLQAIRWKHIGYQSYLSNESGGSRGSSLVSTSQPLYNIVNPNAVIDKLLQHYNDHVYSHLVALVPGSASSPLLVGSVAVEEPTPTLASSTRPRLHSLDHEGLTDTDVTFSDRVVESSGEVNVQYVIAIPYHSLFRTRPLEMPDQLYFPAFGAEHNLIGFYVELKDDRNATIIHFLPLDAQREAQLMIRKEPAQRLLRALLANEQSGEEITMDALRAIGVYGSFTPELLTRAMYSRKKHRDLESMKQDALVHYWVSQVAFDDF